MTKPRGKAKAAGRRDSGKTTHRQKPTRKGEPVVRVLADPETVARAAAGEFVRLSRKLHAKGHAFRVALSGGSTPRRTYELLAQAPFRDMVDWKRVHFFWGDERCVPPDHPDSNYRMIREALLDHADIPAGNFHRMKAELADLEQAAGDYASDLARVLEPQDGNRPRLDMVFLGMGPDGHTASLFPG
ncbi:MAG TPA: 6-phosphogluconolactonase, partial [Deltaproteobacteria bacterium]|nr:6-phosphogluconolactonase [Deltaproteobacteria bacterium]